MLFTGHSEQTIDAKGRLSIPAKYRNQWDATRDGGAWYCIPWPGGQLRLFTEGRFVALAERGEQTLTPGADEADLESTLFGFAERIEPDGAGRITIPKMHLEMTGLGRDVVVVGAKVRLEVRDREAWVAERSERFAQLPDLVKRMSGRA